MLICVNMEDLREQTHTRHYELYRRCKLEEMGFKDTGPECKPVRWAALRVMSACSLAAAGSGDLPVSWWCRFKLCGCSLQQTYEAKRQEFLVELQKREDEMRQMFVQRVKEKEAELKDAEREVSGRDGRCCLQKCFYFSKGEQICWALEGRPLNLSLFRSAAKSFWAAEAPPCRWEGISGGKEEAPRRRPERVQQETSCRPTPAGPEPHGQRQEGQGPQEVSGLLIDTNCSWKRP